MDDDDLREEFADWLRPVREAAPPGTPVIRRRLRRRRARNTAVGTVFLAGAAGIAVIVHLAPTTPRPAPGPGTPPGAAPTVPTVSTGPIPTQNGWASSSSYTISSLVSTLIVNGSLGQITITAEQRSTVSVTEQMVYSATPPSMTRNLAGGTLTLGYGCSNQHMCAASYDIRVPRATAVQVTDQNGGIKLSSLAGPVTASSGLGTITATGLTSATADFNSQQGEIDASFAAVPTEVDATSDMGAISIRVPDTVSYCVTTQVGSLGRANVTVPEDSASPHTITATTQMGTITIVPA
jgi:hypothetical protein